MGEHSVFEKPRWLRDFVRFLPLKSQFVLTGNVRDLQISEAAPGIFAAVPIAHVLHNELKAAEYGATLIYDLVNGFSHVGATENDVAAARQFMERLEQPAEIQARPPVQRRCSRPFAACRPLMDRRLR